MIRERARAVVRGAVQGVGFRPFVYRLAGSLDLDGWVSNAAQGVFIEIEGPRPRINRFLLRLESEKPAQAIIQSLEFSFLEAAGYAGFEIRQSDVQGAPTAFILPDIATCSECLAEIFEPRNRRHRYPFTNCTNCGPRYSIIEALPYDRANTSMCRFAMCPSCRHEYHDPSNRRFHAQPNACPECGPQLALWDETGKVLARQDEALSQAVDAVRGGRILALKGIGGFQLIVDARDRAAVRRLRERKHRAEKPFALLYPSLEMLSADCCVGDFEARSLASPQAPIVLLGQGTGAARLAPEVAPGNPNLGAMLPYSPLHHLLMRELGFPVVATSGNLSDEPICIQEQEALLRLRGIADVFLVHDRPIIRPVDDSVLRVVLDREMMLRRARGYAPLPIHLERELPAILAVGPHLKNTIALSIGREIFVSQHIGDLESAETWSAFQCAAGDLQRLYDFSPKTVACDLHPEYLSTKYARGLPQPALQVQHHYAHVLACMAEHDLDGPVLGVCWDGTGLGTDNTIWGGEFLLIDNSSSPGGSPFVRAAHFRNFRLPGGNTAVKEPRRCALGLLWEIFGGELFERQDLARVRSHFSRWELDTIRQMFGNGLNSPLTSSAGRLFDGVSSILGLRQHTRFEGQAAMDLEFAARASVQSAYSFELIEESRGTVDWAPMILEILDDVRNGESAGKIASMFHNTLVEIILAVARDNDVRRVVLTGGCFQNKHLLESTVRGLRQEGFRPFWHQRIPPNDGGVAVGQILAAARDAKASAAAMEACCA